MLTETHTGYLHQRAWFYASLLFAQGSPAGTHPLHNARLLMSTSGVDGLSHMLDTLASVAIMQRWSGGQS